MRSTWIVRLSVIVMGGLLVQAEPSSQQTSDPDDSDWPMHHHDLAGAGYSPLGQNNTTNVTKLEQIWAYRLLSQPAVASRANNAQSRFSSQATPIVAKGRMYLPAENRVVGLEPETGLEIWQ